MKYSRRRCLVLPGVNIVCTAKVASESIRAAVHDAFGEVPVVEPEDASGPVVAFVRHPLDRLVSAWADRARPGRETQALTRAGLTPGVDLAGFIAVAARAINTDNHVATQASLIAPQGRLLADFVGRFETLGRDWETVRAMCPQLGPLGRKNVSSRGPWQSYYTDAWRDAAARLYRRDMELFNYQC